MTSKCEQFRMKNIKLLISQIQHTYDEELSNMCMSKDDFCARIDFGLWPGSVGTHTAALQLRPLPGRERTNSTSSVPLTVKQAFVQASLKALMLLSAGNLFKSWRMCWEHGTAVASKSRVNLAINQLCCKSSQTRNLRGKVKEWWRWEFKLYWTVFVDSPYG